MFCCIFYASLAFSLNPYLWNDDFIISEKIIIRIIRIFVLVCRNRVLMRDWLKSKWEKMPLLQTTRYSCLFMYHDRILYFCIFQILKILSHEGFKLSLRNEQHPTVWQHSDLAGVAASPVTGLNPAWGLSVHNFCLLILNLSSEWVCVWPRDDLETCPGCTTTFCLKTAGVT